MPWKTQKLRELCELGIEKVDLKYKQKQFDIYIFITVPKYYLFLHYDSTVVILHVATLFNVSVYLSCQFSIVV